MDIAPELYEKIMGAFRAAAETDSRLLQILKDVEGGSIDFAKAYEAARRIGTHAAEALIANLNSDILPNGKMYYNIATRTIEPILQDAYTQAAEIATSIQTNRNQVAGLGLKAIKPEPDRDMLQDFINKVCAAENFDEVGWMLNEPAVRYVEEAPLEAAKKNADFQSRAGVQAKIIRKATRGNCKWCASKVGEYKYPQEAAPEIFQKHDNCSCVVEYDPGIKTGKRQDVFSKKWVEREERNARTKRQEWQLEGNRHLPKTRSLPDEILGRSIGAKWKNEQITDLATGKTYRFVEGTKLQNKEVFAGAGVSTKYRKAMKYANRYGGESEEWMHVKAVTEIEDDADRYWVEVHWSEHKEHGKHDFFIKKWMD